VQYGVNGTYQAGTSFASLAPGNYSISVQSTADATCVTNGTAQTINAVPSLPAAPSVTLTQPTCATPTGTIAFTAQAGVQYGVNGTYQAGTSFASLAPGNYSISVQSTADATCITNGTAQSINAVPSIPAAPSVTLTQPTCATPTGTIAFTAQAGVQYGVNGTYQAGTSFASLAPGNYSISVQSTADATCITNGIAQTINAVPSLPAAPSVTLTQPTCATPTGTIAFTTQAGVQYGVNGIYQAGTSFASLAPGNYSISVRNSSDNTCITNGASQTINPSPACAPIAFNDSGNGNEDQPLVLPSVQSNDIDSNGTVVTNTIDLDPSTPGIQTTFNSANGNWTVNPVNGNVTFTPNLNYNGTETIPYTIQDNSGLTSNAAILTAVISPVNDAPVVDNETHVINEDGSASGDLTNAGDSDVDGNLVVNTTPLSGPANGTITINANGTYTYTPNANFNGNDQVIVQICDDGTPLPAICVNDTIFITVNPINDAPVVDNETHIINEDGSASGDLTNAGDSDVDGNLVVNTTPLSGPANGTIIINPNGTYTYTPNANFNGNDQVIVQICDDGTPLPAICVNDTIFITVNPINDAPVVDNETHIINEDGSASGDLTNAGDSDVDGNLVVNTTPLSGPANGTIIINPNGTYTYTPNANFNGNDQVIVQICDDGTPLPAICVNDTIFITVNPVNDPPIADNENIVLNEDGSFSGDLTDSGDFDPDGTTLVCAPTPGYGPFHGTIIINSNGTYTYTPNANYFGNDTVVVEVCDQGLPLPGLCTYDTIFITINPINDAPVATIDFTSTFEGIPVSLSVLSNDTDIDGIINTASGTIVQNGSNGTAVISNGTITYTPNTGFVGQDTVIYQVCDNGVPVLCDTAMVIITVNPCLNNPNADCDGDGVDNATEAANNTDPSNNCSFLLASQNLPPNATWLAADCDGDGVTNQTELNDNTDPLNSCDYLAVNQTLPTSPSYNAQDCDGDGVTNEDEIDPDGDGTPGPNGTDPQNPCSMNAESITVAIDPVWATSDCDGDGVTNGTEIDPDGDGIPGPNGTDPINGCSFTLLDQTLNPSNAWLASDCDGDGVTNGNEIDPDGDGIPGPNGTNPLEPCSYVSIAQTLPPNQNWFDLDCDGDGVINGNEIDPDGDGQPGPNGTDPQNPCSLNVASQSLAASLAWNGLDCDGDGVTNEDEIDPDGDGTPGPNGTDILNSCDFNLASQTQTPDSSWFANDCDGDGVSNEDELDPDGDGTPGPNGTNPSDPCSLTLANQSMNPSPAWLAADCDGDGVTNGTEIDPDGDGTPGPNGTDPTDPCSLTVANQNTAPSPAWLAADCDGDGVTNGTEIDPDGDGAPGPNGTDPNDPCSLELANQTLATSANWNSLDCDGDGVPNGVEIDSDGDGNPGPDVTDVLDPCSYVIAAQTLPTNATWNDADCDGDGVPNGTEVLDGTNPQNPCEFDSTSIVLPLGPGYWNADCDSDGISNGIEDSLGTDPWNVDTDGDGISDGDEFNQGSNPLDPCDPNATGPSCNEGIFIPEAFTPDGDAANEYFVITGIENYTDNKLTIFNRWGNVVYSMDAYQNQWNGISNGSMVIGSDPLPTGTYYYLLDLYGDGKTVYKGSIYLKR
jgi:gliding motility-associated-like protein